MSDVRHEELPVAVIGAGLIGLAAAARLAERRVPFIVLDSGHGPGSSIREWGHVRLFTPWSTVVDPAAGRLLAASGWHGPEGTAHPTGHDVVQEYLRPLASVPQLSPHIRFGHRVTGIARAATGKLHRSDRSSVPFVLATSRSGDESRLLARAVIDASGTWRHPNPLGADGLPAAGEPTAADLISYGPADVLGTDRELHAGAHTIVVGSGHSAQNVVLDLAELASQVPGTRITWVVRRGDPRSLFNDGRSDVLPARAKLGDATRSLVESGTVDLVSGFGTEQVLRVDDTLTLRAGDRLVGPAERVVAATGFRPDLEITRELRLDLDPAFECPRAIAPIIDPALHSCTTVPLHGSAELSHPEPGYYIVGMKSYGRAPTFLAMTGYEQVRAVVDALAVVPAHRGEVTDEERVPGCAPDVACCGPIPATHGSPCAVAAPSCS